MAALTFNTVSDIATAYLVAFNDGRALWNYYEANNVQPTFAQTVAVNGQFATLISAFVTSSQALVNVATAAGMAVTGLGLAANIASVGANITQLGDAVAFNNFDGAVGASLGLLSAIAGFAHTFNTVGSLILGNNAALLFLGALQIVIVVTAAQLLWQNKDSIVWAANEFSRAFNEVLDESTFAGDLARSAKVVSDFLLNTADPLVKLIKYVMVDPLVLDLDGDGLEITPLSRGVQFDGNGDTIRTNTSWADADDGLLALDRNGNGVIDSGRELFGDETLLANGKKAAHGFAALAELDVGGAANATGGVGDGLFDAKDAQYANVRIWRDLNQDGISQAGELQTLAEAGIASVKLSSTKTDTSYGDAQLVQSGSFTRADGTEGQAGSFIFAQNNAVTTHPPIAISADAAKLPAIQGSAWVHGLQETATSNPQLLQLFSNVQEAHSRADYSLSISELLLEWGRESAHVTASEQALEEDGLGLIMRAPASDQEMAWLDMAVKADKETRAAFRSTLSPEDCLLFDNMRFSMVGQLEKLYAYEAFTGLTFLSWPELKLKETPPSPVLASGRPVEVNSSVSAVMKLDAYAKPEYPGYKVVYIPSPLQPITKPYIDFLWDRLVEDATRNLLPSLRLSQYADLVQVNVSETGVDLDFSQMDAALEAVSATNAYEGAVLFLDIYRTYGDVFKNAKWDGAEKLRTLMQAGAHSEPIRQAFAATGLNLVTASSQGSVNDDSYAGDVGADTFNGDAGNDFIDGGAGDDNLLGGTGDDLLLGGAGNDTLNGGDGADVLQGDDGDDQLHGGNGADTLIGGDGNDSLYAAGLYGGGSAGAGDTLDGGAGNDNLYGGFGSQTYLFGKGDGQDTITNYADAWNGYADNTVGKQDVLQFKAGVLVSEVSVSREGDNLVLKINGSTDRVTVNGYFGAGGQSTNTLQAVRFEDGTSWDYAQVVAKTQQSIASSQQLAGQISKYAGLEGEKNDAFEPMQIEEILLVSTDTVPFEVGTFGSVHNQPVAADVMAATLKPYEVFAPDTVGGYVREVTTAIQGAATLENQAQQLLSAMAGFAPPPAAQTQTFDRAHQTLLSAITAASSH